MTVDEIIAEHPNLTHKDIFDAQEFAADYLADEQIAVKKLFDVYPERRAGRFVVIDENNYRFHPLLYIP